MPEDEQFIKQSLEFLKKIYEKQEGNAYPINKYSLGRDMNYDVGLTERVVNYLQKEQFVTEEETTLQTDEASILKITNKGKEKINT